MARVATPIVIQLKKRTGPGAAPPAADDPSPGSGIGDGPTKSNTSAYDPLAADEVASPASPPPLPSSPVRGRSPLPGVGSPAPPPSPSPPPTAGDAETPAGLDTESLKGVVDDAIPSATPWGPSFAATPSLLDVVTLADMFRGFHADVEAWVKEESEKLFEQESKIQGARRNLQERSDLIRGFLKEFSPNGLVVETGSDEEADKSEDDEDAAEDDEEEEEPGHRRRKRPGAGDDSEGDAASGSEAENGRGKRKMAGRKKARSREPQAERDIFAKSALPQFLQLVAEDQRALQDASELLATFVQRHFPNNKELAQLLSKGSPVALFRAMLRVLVSALGVSQPKDKKDGATKRGGDRDRRGADDKGGKRGRSRERGRDGRRGRDDGRGDSRDEASEDSRGGGDDRDGRGGGRDGRGDRDGRYERDGRGGRDDRGEKDRGGRSRSRDGGRKPGRDGGDGRRGGDGRDGRGGRSRSGGRGRDRRGDERDRRK